MTESAREYATVIDSPVGKLGIRLSNERLAGLDYLPEIAKLKPATTALAKRVVRELEHYFDSPGQGFGVPLELHGTAYQQRVWTALAAIPAGETRSYGELATLLQSGARAVGNACRENPVPIIVPCHRIIGRNGAGGYAGQVAGVEVERKQWLLAHETLVGRA